MLSELIFLTNLTLDEDNHDEVRRLGLPMGNQHDPESVLTNAEIALLGEGGHAILGVPHADLMLGHSVLYQSVKCACPTIEFHFRNDKTRGRWGTPITLEEDLPERGVQTKQARKVRQKVRTALPLCGDVELELDSLETKDRHTLYITIPFAWLARAEIKTHDEYLAFLRGILFLDDE